MSPTTTCSARGFVMGRLPFGNTSLILRWLTPEAGRISTMARGALKPNSPFGLQFDLYYLCDIEYFPARQGDMHRLKEVRLLEPNLHLRREWVTLLALEYFASLIEEMTEPSVALPDDFDLFSKSVTYLKDHPVTRMLVERFERRMMLIHGLGHEGENAFPEAFSRHHLHLPPQRDRLFREIETMPGLQKSSPSDTMGGLT